MWSIPSRVGPQKHALTGPQIRSHLNFSKFEKYLYQIPYREFSKGI